MISVSIVTVIGEILTPHFDLINIVLLYLLPVLVSAVRWGRGPSFFSSFLGVLTFNFFFVPPIFTFAVGNMQHLFVLVVFFLVALVTGTMATKLRNELEKATEREKKTLTLYALSREIAAKADLEQVLKTFVDKVAETINGAAIVLIQDPNADVLRQNGCNSGDNTVFDEKEYAVAHWVLEHGQPAGKGLGIFEGERSLFFFPIKAEDKTLAVLGIRPNIENATLSPEQRQLIETFTNLAAVAIVRLQLAKEAEQAKWLAESERLHRTLLNSISHDFRTPLASITGAVTSLLAEGSVYTPETKEIFLHTIKEEAHRMNRFIENLLDMVRLESGTLKLNMKWCDIQDIIGVVLRETRDTLQGHPLRIDIPPDLPSIKADFILIEQVIINLLENAAKYSLPVVQSPFQLIARTKHCFLPWLIPVRLFQRQNRSMCLISSIGCILRSRQAGQGSACLSARESSKPMAAAYGLIHRLNTAIGSPFLSLYRKNFRNNKMPEKEQIMSADGARILVVDDEKQIRRMLKAALEGYGYDIGEAASGHEGLSQTSIFHPDVIILDLGLPDLDGIEVIQRLREWTQVPIIVLSVREHEDDKIKALDAGADDYVTKPFSMGELLARLRAALRRTAKSEDDANTHLR